MAGGDRGRVRRFGGLLLDITRALVKHHDAAIRKVEFNDRLHAFARYWDVRPIACAPYRGHTKSKDERGVGYIKHNAIAGRRFASWIRSRRIWAWWMYEIADVRVHATTGEVQIVRFEREEQQALRPLNGRPPFRQLLRSDRSTGGGAQAHHAPLDWSAGRYQTHQVAAARRPRLTQANLSRRRSPA